LKKVGIKVVSNLFSEKEIAHIEKEIASIDGNFNEMQLKAGQASSKNGNKKIFFGHGYQWPNSEQVFRLAGDLPLWLRSLVT
jgi:hypothetical protein